MDGGLCDELHKHHCATDLGNNIAIPHGSEKEIIKSKIVIATLKNYFMESTSSTDYFYDCYEYERTSSN